MASKIKGTEGVEFPDGTTQSSAAYSKAELNLFPAFSVFGSNAYPVTNGVPLKLDFGQEDANFGNNYDAVNSRFVAPVSGIYQFDAHAVGRSLSTQTGFVLSLRINGAESNFLSGLDSINPSAARVQLSRAFYLAAGDYVEAWGIVYGTSPSIPDETRWLSGFLVRRAAP